MDTFGGGGVDGIQEEHGLEALMFAVPD